MEEIEFKNDHMIIGKRAVFLFELIPINIFSLTSEEQDRYYGEMNRLLSAINDIDIQICIKTRRMYPFDVVSHIVKLGNNRAGRGYCNELNNYISTHYISFKEFYLSISFNFNDTRMDFMKLRIDLLRSYLGSLGIKIYQLKDSEMKQTILDYI